MPSTKLHTTTIEYTSSKCYKITITTDHKLRIKIPQDRLFEKDSQLWIEMCHKALDEIKGLPEPIIKTLRYKVNFVKPRKSMVLRSKSDTSYKIPVGRGWKNASNI